MTLRFVDALERFHHVCGKNFSEPVREAGAAAVVRSGRGGRPGPRNGGAVASRRELSAPSGAGSRSSSSGAQRPASEAHGSSTHTLPPCAEVVLSIRPP